MKKLIKSMLICFSMLICSCNATAGNIQPSKQTQAAFELTKTADTGIRLADLLMDSQDLLDLSGYYSKEPLDLTAGMDTPEKALDFYKGQYNGTGSAGDLIITMVRYINEDEVNNLVLERNREDLENGFTKIEIHFSIELPLDAQLVINEDGNYQLRFSHGTVMVEVLLMWPDLDVDSAGYFLPYVGDLQIQKLMEAGY